MSTKTNFKRVALVAVASLGLGVLTSIAPANATFAAGDIVVKTAVGSYNTAADMCANTTASGVDSATIPLDSNGLWLTTVASADANDDPMLVIDGSARFNPTNVYFGGVAAIGANWAISDAVTAIATNITAGGTLSVGVAADHISIKPTALGTFKIYTYATSAATTATDVITVTVVASCASDALALSKSYYSVVANTGTDTSWTSTVVDASGASLATNGTYGYIHVRLRDAYSELLATSSALVVNATGDNCKVGISGAAAYGSLTAIGKSATAVSATIADDHVISVGALSSLKPATCVVTSTWGGTVIGTKTITVEGPAATITVSETIIGSTTANTGLYRVAVADAAGNPLSGQVIDFSSSEANNAAALASGVITSPQATSGAATISSSTATDGKTFAVAYADRAETNMTSYTCGKEGVAKITVRTAVDSPVTTYITSAPFDVVCGGALDTWSISMDKASYAPGEIATLTLSGKTAKGNPVATFTFLSGVEYSTGGMTAVTAPTNNDAFSSGVGTKKYSFSVGTTEGSFVGTFKTTGATDTAAKTVQYKVAATTAGVSNADVLKAIVSLIASINKQIAALQKALLKK
jgi:hypothetical protein